MINFCAVYNADLVGATMLNEADPYEIHDARARSQRSLLIISVSA